MLIEHILNENNDLSYEDTEFFKHYGENVLFHSSRSKEQEGFLPFRPRALPRDSFTPFHNEINMLAKQKFNLPIRNLLFAMSAREDAASYNLYGKPYAVYPASTEYRLFYSKKFGDMTNDLRATSVLVMMGLQSELDAIIRNILSSRNAPLDEQEVTIVQKNTSIVMRRVFSDSELRRTSISLKSFFNEVIKEVVEHLKKQRFSNRERDIVSDRILKYRVQYQNLALDYINTVVEISSPQDIANTNGKEIMVYDPKGFFFVP